MLPLQQDLQDDMADMLEIANEVQDTLGRTYGMPDDIDEADLDAGLLLLNKIIDHQALTIHMTPTLSWNTAGDSSIRKAHNKLSLIPSLKKQTTKNKKSHPRGDFTVLSDRFQ